MSPIRVLLVDDQASVRDGLRMRLGLESDVQVVGAVSDGASTLAALGTLTPDVVLLDVQLGAHDGIALIDLIRRQQPASAVVMLSMYDDQLNRQRAAAAGARAFIGKQQAIEDLLATIRAVVAQAR